MKTERITVLVSPALKKCLIKKARSQRISVSELVRRRCEQGYAQDEALLSTLTAQLREATESASAALDAGLAAVHSTRAAIQKSTKAAKE